MKNGTRVRIVVGFLLVNAILSLSGCKDQSTRAAENSEIQTETTADSSTTEIQEIVIPEVVETEEVEQEIIISEILEDDDAQKLPEIPLYENRERIKGEKISIDEIFVTSTNRGSVSYMLDEESEHKIIDITCNVGEEILPFNIFWNNTVGYYEDFMHKAYCTVPNDRNVVYYQTYDGNIVFFLNDMKLISLREFLTYNGLQEKIKETYTFDEVKELYSIFNKAMASKTNILEQK